MENQNLWLQSNLWMSVWNLYQILPLRREPLQLCLLIQNSSKNHKLLGLSLVWLPLLRWKAKFYLYALFFIFYLTHQITRSSASIIFIPSPPLKKRGMIFFLSFSDNCRGNRSFLIRLILKANFDDNPLIPPTKKKVNYAGKYLS